MTIGLCVAVSGCTIEEGAPVIPHSAVVNAPVSITEIGKGDFLFDYSAGLGPDPIRVWYHAPPSDLATADILIVMTGAHRDGDAYREDWLPFLPGHNTLLLVPELSDEAYPGAASYNVGNMLDRRGNLQARDLWSFNLVEALFDHVVADIGSSAVDYAIFGHSAGAQFVHRFIEFMPDTRVRVAVAANAGWYTVLDDKVPFPYGIKDAPVNKKKLISAFSRPLTVMLGADDIDSHDPSLQRDKNTDLQGTNRLSRGINFYQSARESAESTGALFNWQLIVVPGVAHSHHEMAEAASGLVLQPFQPGK